MCNIVPSKVGVHSSAPRVRTRTCLEPIPQNGRNTLIVRIALIWFRIKEKLRCTSSGAMLLSACYLTLSPHMHTLFISPTIISHLSTLLSIEGVTT